MDYVKTADGRLRVWETFRDVTPSELFDYWTKPDKLTRWWPDEAVVDPAPGGRYRYGFLASGHTLTGTFAEVRPAQRLAFSWRWEHEPRLQQVVVDFEARDAATLLTVTQGPYGEGETAKERQNQLDDWTHAFRKLKAAVRPG